MTAILVTGAAAGIGLATAKLLSARGHRVFAGVRSTDRATELRASHPELTPLVLDVANPSSRRTAVLELTAALEARGDTLVGLVNNAGIVVQGPLETLDIDELRRQFDVNLFGLAGVTQGMIPLLRAAAVRGHRATIVNIGSIGGRFAIPFNGPYNASKFALVGYSAALRQELRPWNVRVCLVEPGTTRTAIWHKAERSVEASCAGGGGPLYGSMLAGYQTSVRTLQKRGIEPGVVANIIARQLSARWPAHRVLVGDARLVALIAWLPAVLTDYLMARGLGLPKAGAFASEGRRV